LTNCGPEGEPLYDGNRLDHHLICGIVDVAHLVTTRARAEGDLKSAREATQIATTAASYKEIPKLDLAAIATAAGHRRQTAEIIRDNVCNRSDDGQPPLELSERSEHILSSRLDATDKVRELTSKAHREEIVGVTSDRGLADRSDI
jgi:hypothetical protein